MTSRIWKFWARRYDRLWVQKYSLRPTREFIINTLEKDLNEDSTLNLLDLGSGPGELVSLIEKKYNNINISAIDFSEEMLRISLSKNHRTRHINLDIKDLYKIEDKFNIIICTHSLPYYKDLDSVFMDLYRLLENDGNIYLAFASGNSLYDKLALSFVKLTTGPANYPSDRKFRKYIEAYFLVESFNIIKERFFMPEIAVYKLSKVIE